ncbi:hypothetical protein H2198_007373 [Neophaeococcomyces mojaviensis]|uniref:Uncharacterized protein n=1 Tax=Neophaeococcomyces mojaviensis TaxID=3383035 RepID=A0ACC3A054_9EURO|nr:hypothetical protein H2198_007373 [Knufia sp. JES_112]
MSTQPPQTHPYTGLDVKMNDTWRVNDRIIRVSQRTRKIVFDALVYEVALYWRWRFQYPIAQTPKPPFDIELHKLALSYLVSVCGRDIERAQIALSALMLEVGVQLGFTIPYLRDSNGVYYQGEFQARPEAMAWTMRGWVATKEDEKGKEQARKAKDEIVKK